MICCVSSFGHSVLCLFTNCIAEIITHLSFSFFSSFFPSFPTLTDHLSSLPFPCGWNWMHSDDENEKELSAPTLQSKRLDQVEEGEEDGGAMGEDGEDDEGEDEGEDEEDPSEYLLDPSLLTEATLPISNISRLMKKALPKQAKISSSSKELIQSCCIEFISFMTSEALDKCLLEKRKTINGDDILYAMKVLGFEEFEIVCRIWLSRYRMVSG